MLTQPFKHVFTRGHATNWKHYISIITLVMVRRLISVVTYCKKLPPINLYKLSMSWSCEYMWQIKHIISPPAEDLRTPKLGKALTCSERLLSLKPYDHLITWPTWGLLIIWKSRHWLLVSFKAKINWISVDILTFRPKNNS